MAITTGPFRAPLLMQNGTAPDTLAIDLTNPTRKNKTVRVIVERWDLSPTPTAGTIIFDQVITLPPNSSQFVNVLVAQGFIPGALYRVTVIGDTDEDAEGIEVVVNGGANGFHEPTMFFRHEDFVEID
ncbi:hypothetical protein [Calidifontibacillus erzurumensis]|uniref:Uncharacterized protein n=1 Tax=Calidifontibacillus erzurumensis TaxID=2741433 RepID=A0A8J8KBI1_9BACI|nr:hypothetical protein [Calidifontibacillus erzurumensis]NSL51083.1 hypothetical protein [Calidifontibacillus erzurumensis]